MSTLIALAVGALVGCGGDDDANGAAETASSDGAGMEATVLPREQYIRRADAICEDTIERRDTAFERYLEREGLTIETIDFEARAEPLSEVYLGVYRTQQDRLRALGTPEEGEEQAEEILDGMERILDEIEERPEDFVLNPNPFGPFSEAAREYGFETCAEAYFGGPEG